MKSSKYAIVTIQSHEPKGYFTLDAASDLSGMHAQMIEVFVQGCVIPVAARGIQGSPLLDVNGLDRLREIQRLRVQGRASLKTIRYISVLLDRLDYVERRIDEI